MFALKLIVKLGSLFQSLDTGSLRWTGCIDWNHFSRRKEFRIGIFGVPNPNLLDVQVATE